MAYSSLFLLIKRAEDADRHQHACTGIAKCCAWLQGATVGLASDRHDAARRLPDHIEGQELLVRATLGKAFNLSVDNATIE